MSSKVTGPEASCFHIGRLHLTQSSPCLLLYGEGQGGIASEVDRAVPLKTDEPVGETLLAAGKQWEVRYWGRDKTAVGSPGSQRRLLTPLQHVE